VYASIIKLIAGNNNAGVLIVMSIFTISNTNEVKINYKRVKKDIKLANNIITLFVRKLWKKS
jgi:hypothetical protein